MPKLIFKIHPVSTRDESTRGGKAKEHGRSPIKIVLRDKNKVSKSITENTDQILFTLDKLLKRNKIEVGSFKDIKLEIDKKAGLTSQRIIKAIIKALRLDLDPV